MILQAVLSRQHMIWRFADLWCEIWYPCLYSVVISFPSKLTIKLEFICSDDFPTKLQEREKLQMIKKLPWNHTYLILVLRWLLYPSQLWNHKLGNIDKLQIRFPETFRNYGPFGKVNQIEIGKEYVYVTVQLKNKNQSKQKSILE